MGFYVDHEFVNETKTIDKLIKIKKSCVSYTQIKIFNNWVNELYQKKIIDIYEHATLYKLKMSQSNT